MKSAVAVIDTETNWHDEVMSVGIVIAEKNTWKPLGTMYCIITPECCSGGMYSSVMNLKNIKTDIKSDRKTVMNEIVSFFRNYNVDSVFAYNAKFDYSHLPELSSYRWYDIMRLAAYRQYNRTIDDTMECCKTGRLKRDYGVEPVLRRLSGVRDYCEVHNALCDAADELKIVKLLGHDFDTYEAAAIN